MLGVNSEDTKRRCSEELEKIAYNYWNWQKK